MPTKEEILKMLDKLEFQNAESVENEEIEFKPWLPEVRENQRIAREYTVCFANAKGGTIVFGVKDKTVTRAAAIHGCRGCHSRRRGHNAVGSSP